MTNKPEPTKTIKTRRMKASDLPAVEACQHAAYPNMPSESLSDARKFKMQLAKFPNGQFVAECDGKIVGYSASLIVQLDEDSPWYSYDEITGVGTFSTHNPGGDTLYGADIAVHPDFRGQGVAAKLYVKRKSLLMRLNLRRMVAGGRIPGYAAHAKRMTADEYVEAVVRGELKDMALSAHLKAGYQVRSVQYAYLRDAASMNYATYLELLNPSFDSAKRAVAAAPIHRTFRKVRICAAQYQLRPIKDWNELERQVHFFAETANEYHCHFLLLPELFTVQLFSSFPRDMESRQAVLKVAEFYDEYKRMFVKLANEFNLYIIGGSTPAIIDGELRNTAHLFTPSGEIHTQDKLHITPVERHYYGCLPGDAIRVFDTPMGRIGIVVCYDVEFPELVRLIALNGVEVLFVPFATDERKSYFRVRHCAQARAVENVMYVVLAGCVGNLPQVRSFLVNYGQAAVCTPCDVAFPKDGILAEADPNTETVVVAELDLGGLVQQRTLGSVRPMQDRRSDLYELTSKHPVEIVRVQ
ncbi:bifunctional GNAT family N-acetyltransferase/carbon-nitrogen hydrolase family protein [Novipirellula artificiosorum]|uniref:2-oxoglutaramate amidase n=1 Tax=Novipirellula artificiosorum TaxID=2528016 RepID=A0A5C6CL34_9BACT|nr:bifunctional GNAT family N-acetyltransferase/carbon-nitrogen hydrolase family protein [Novipirellula artificiosorum]TWU23846.1 2-oxoglutaramate amidase [Novipirellula artificiosorum]